HRAAGRVAIDHDAGPEEIPPQRAAAGHVAREGHREPGLVIALRLLALPRSPCLGRHAHGLPPLSCLYQIGRPTVDTVYLQCKPVKPFLRPGRSAMRSIDIHAHLVPQTLWQAAAAGREWYGFRHEPGEGLGTFLGTNGKRTGFTSPKVRLTPEERLQDMDAQGVDMQVISIHTPLFGYHLDPAQGLALAREGNDEIAAMTRQWPTRFAGLATLRVQDVRAAIDELERAVTVLGLKGAELDTVVNGENW